MLLTFILNDAKRILKYGTESIFYVSRWPVLSMIACMNKVRKVVAHIINGEENLWYCSKVVSYKRRG